MAETAPILMASPGRDANEVSEAATQGRAPSPTSAVTPPTPPTSHPLPSPPKTPLNQVYALPAPIRTFPLPTFYPNNPISLFHLAFAWLSQVFRPPPPEPSVVHIGVWDPETRSVHVRDPTSIRALWEQGFFGKGSLSRSEPNWLKRELARRGSPDGKTVSEARTELRREERRLAKWERAKAELEAIERQRLAEAASHAASAEASKANGIPNGHVDDLAESPLSRSVQDGSVSEPGSTDAVENAARGAVACSVVGSVPGIETAADTGRNGCPADVLEQVRAPVGPAEILALPNSLIKPNSWLLAREQSPARKPPIGPAELLSLPNSLSDLASKFISEGSGPRIAGRQRDHQTPPPSPPRAQVNGHVGTETATLQTKVNGTNGHDIQSSVSGLTGHEAGGVSIHRAHQPNSFSDGVATPPPSLPSSDDSAASMSAQDTGGKASQPLKRPKSVRFSPTVKSTTFQHSDPPSPNRSADAASKSATPTPANRQAVLEIPSPPPPISPPSKRYQPSLDVPVTPPEIENKEHFQLAPEEAFFLVFALGALSVVDPVTASPIPSENLLTLFRSYSYFPPRAAGSSALRPDDPFLIHYAVYHHFRSLCWVPRHGIKFGVDWVLYQRGPVFDHSEFGVVVLPAYSDALWDGQEHAAPRRSWSWLMGVNRVLSHALKSLVLVYVDVPPPAAFEEAMRRGGMAAALKKYAIREVMVRRFSVNRNR